MFAFQNWKPSKKEGDKKASRGVPKKALLFVPPATVLDFETIQRLLTLLIR